MPDSLLASCYGVTRDPRAALDVFWNLPLAQLFQFVHCEVVRNGSEVRFAAANDDAIGIIRRGLQ